MERAPSANRELFVALKQIRTSARAIEFERSRHLYDPEISWSHVPRGLSQAQYPGWWLEHGWIMTFHPVGNGKSSQLLLKLNIIFQRSRSTTNQITNSDYGSFPHSLRLAPVSIWAMIRYHYEPWSGVQVTSYSHDFPWEFIPSLGASVSFTWSGHAMSNNQAHWSLNQTYAYWKIQYT